MEICHWTVSINDIKRKKQWNESEHYKWHEFDIRCMVLMHEKAFCDLVPNISRSGPWRTAGVLHLLIYFNNTNYNVEEQQLL